MKRIEAFIQPHRLPKIVAALHDLPAFPGFTVIEAHGQGHGRGAGGHFIHEPNDGLLYQKCSYVMVICDDDAENLIVQALASNAHTGTRGDGLIAVTDVSKAIRVRDGEPRL